MAVLAAVAFAIRAAVAFDLGRLPLFVKPQLDSLEFLIWARGMVERGFSWPSLPTKGPGYAVFLAGLIRLFGESLPAIRLAQAALGALTAVLVGVLAARWGAQWGEGRRVGLVAGLLVALYGPLVYVEVSLLAEGLLILLLVAALVVYTQPHLQAGRALARAAALGALLGFATLVRATALPLIPAFALLLLFDRRQPGSFAGGEKAARSRLPAVALLVGVALLVVLPVTRAMSRTTGSSFLVQGYGGLNLYMGNAPGHEGVPWARPGGEWDGLEARAVAAGARTAAEQDRFFVAETRKEIAARPLAFLGVLGKKVLWLLSADEIRESHAYGFFAARSWLLTVLPGFALLGPLALWGLFRAARRRAVWPVLWVHLGVFTASCVLIIVASRYRLPLVPGLALFAAATAVELWDGARAQRWREIAPAAVVVIALAGVSLAIRHAPSHVFAEEWALTAQAQRAAGDVAGAEASYRRATEADPGSALAWAGLGSFFLDQQRLSDAEVALAKAVALNPSFAFAQSEQGRLQILERQPEAAVRSLRAALALVPQHLPSLRLLGPLLLAQGKVDEAEPVLVEVARLDPGDVDAHLGLARLAGARRRPREGLAEAQQAAALAPGRIDAWTTVAFLALDARDLDTAAAALARARALAGPAGSPEVRYGEELLARLRDGSAP